ncbi:MAG TPA: hypothetical protein VK789_10850 [Bryobacteraceae bacterium]|nr:hypothetical protein [Bryobacteraceae bacterium]
MKSSLEIDRFNCGMIDLELQILPISRSFTLRFTAGTRLRHKRPRQAHRVLEA